MWKDDPDSVTPRMIHEAYPKVRTLRLETSGLLVTYGELNTLPDYLPNPAVLDAQPRSIMLPILQGVRQEGYNKVNRMLKPDSPLATFAHAVSVPWKNDFINLLVETQALNSLTLNLGPARTNHYTALVGRNACHFAPYSWYRWQQFHLVARDLAKRAHAVGDFSGQRARLTAMAWQNHGVRRPLPAGLFRRRSPGQQDPGHAVVRRVGAQRTAGAGRQLGVDQAREHRRAARSRGVGALRHHEARRDPRPADRGGAGHRGRPHRHGRCPPEGRRLPELPRLS